MLSLKKRPQKISEVIGQEMVVKYVKKKSIDRKFPSYMYFNGPTGTGKNTVAYIISKLILCENPIKNSEGYYDPCDACKSCKAISNGKLNVGTFTLINCATTRTGDVKGRVQTLYEHIDIMYDKRITLLDEFQDATGGGKLQTLLCSAFERSRENDYVILSTLNNTSIKKSLRDRCTTFNFSKVSDLKLANHLSETMKQIQVQVPTGCSEEQLVKNFLLIAKYADGSVRCALEGLSKCIELNAWTEEEIHDSLK